MFKHFLVFISLTILLTACQPGATVTPPPDGGGSTPVAPTIALPSVTPTPPNPETLVVCLGQEPSTLYPYGGSSRSQWSVLESIYDGPVDKRNKIPQPVILEKIPSLAGGDAAIQPVDVLEGQVVVDSTGSLVALAKGVSVLPSGCNNSSCAVEWNGQAPFQMDQLHLTYKLKAGIQWSDGSPLKGSDSVYSFQLASDPATPVAKQNVYRTMLYRALDDVTVEWAGMPGYLPDTYDAFFWLPLPEHAWTGMPAQEILNNDLANRQPLGWGPYTVTEWIAGDHITLKKNPLYYRAAEGLPKFENLVYRFLGEQGDNNIEGLLVGECDIVDQTTLLDTQLELILDLQRANKLAAFIGQGPEWEHLDFGIRPSSYDDGYQAGVDRPDFFGDLRVRQAFAYCSDRAKIIESLFYGQSSVPASYLPPGHPLLAQNLSVLPYDPAAGAKLLDEAGWKDTDGDPHTPRQAFSVTGVVDGTPLAVNYITTQADLRIETGKILAQSLAECGIQINTQYETPGVVYAAGPDGPLFGRKFDLAQFGWESGLQPPCPLYSTNQTPTAANEWIGTNVTGYSSPAYDAACSQAIQSRPDQPEYMQQHQEAQRLFNQDLPVLPLYYRLHIAVARPDLCGLEMDVTARSLLWNLEALGYGLYCPAQ